MRDYGNQKKEIETIKPRSIELKMSDQDVDRILKKAGSVGISVEELLESFIGDLVDGTYSNGSDERMYADMWFERCGFSMPIYNSFLSYLIKNQKVDNVIELLNEIETNKYILDKLQKEIESGRMEAHGRIYTWRDIVDSNQEPVYSSKREWEVEKMKELEEYSELLSQNEEEIKNIYQEYLNNHDNEDSTYEEEIEKVIEWNQKRNIFKRGAE